MPPVLLPPAPPALIRLADAPAPARASQPALAWPVQVAAPVAPFDGVDLFGSSQVSLDDIIRRYGTMLAAFGQAVRAQDTHSMEQWHQQLVHGIQSMGNFAFVEISPIQYPNDKQKLFVTIDLVDAADASRRMPFAVAPSELCEDPDGLLAAWSDYEKKGFDLLLHGELRDIPEKCDAWHCLWGFNDPSLAPFKARFDEDVPRYVPQLVNILHNDRDPLHRAHAAFLLAHQPDGNFLVAELMPCLHDRDAEVRNNALRVLAYIAKDHPEVVIPVEPVVEALSFPTTTDRNKAAAVLAFLAQRSPDQPLIISRGGAIVLAMLKLSQPNNHDWAYKILTALSGKKFGEHDIAAWSDWLAHAK